MNSKHKLIIQFDETAGEISVTHSVITEIAGNSITYSEDVPLVESSIATMVGNLKTILNANREVMENLGTKAAVVHVAELHGKGKGNSLKLTGNIAVKGELNDVSPSA